MRQIDIDIEGDKYQVHPMTIYYDITGINKEPYISKLIHRDDDKQRNLWHYFKPKHWVYEMCEQRMMEDCSDELKEYWNYD